MGAEHTVDNLLRRGECLTAPPPNIMLSFHVCLLHVDVTRCVHLQWSVPSRRAQLHHFAPSRTVEAPALFICAFACYGVCQYTNSFDLVAKPYSYFDLVSAPPQFLIRRALCHHSPSIACAVVVIPPPSRAAGLLCESHIRCVIVCVLSYHLREHHLAECAIWRLDVVCRVPIRHVFVRTTL